MGASGSPGDSGESDDFDWSGSGAIGLLVIGASDSRNSGHLRASATPTRARPRRTTRSTWGPSAAEPISSARAIDDSSVVVGRSYHVQRPASAVHLAERRHDATRPASRHERGGRPTDINESGVVVGATRMLSRLRQGDGVGWGRSYCASWSSCSSWHSGARRASLRHQ